MNSGRPIIKIIPDSIDKRIETVALILFVIMWSITLFLLSTLPPTIPVHFNFKGEADGYGNKLTLLVLPILGTCIYFGFTVLNKYPHIFNYLTPITKENAEKQYTLATRMLRYLKAAVLLLFTTIIVFVYLNVKNIVNGIGWWFLPFTLLLMLGPAIYFISKSLKK